MMWWAVMRLAAAVRAWAISARMVGGPVRVRISVSGRCRRPVKLQNTSLNTLENFSSKYIMVELIVIGSGLSNKIQENTLTARIITYHY